MTRLMAAFLLAAACAGPASAKQEGPDAASLEGAFAEASGAARAAAEDMLGKRVLPPEGSALYRSLWVATESIEACRRHAPAPGEPLAYCVDPALLRLRQAAAAAVQLARRHPEESPLGHPEESPLGHPEDYGPARGFETVDKAASWFNCSKDVRLNNEPAYPGECVEGFIRTVRSVFPAAVYQELIGRVSAAWVPDETGLIDIPVRAVGGGTSMTFTKGQCLFCTRYREQAETMAKERAKANAEAVCERKRGFLAREPEAEVTDCSRVDGWVSYYLCAARAWGVCRAPIPR